MHFQQTADSDTVFTYQVSSMQLVSFGKSLQYGKYALLMLRYSCLSYALFKASSYLSVTNCTEETC